MKRIGRRASGVGCYSIRLVCVIVPLAFLALKFLTVSAQEPLPTATPDAEGIIYVEVQPNDSLWNIAAQAGLTLNQLLEMNGLSENALIQPGQRLIVGFSPPPVTPTLEPLPTATLPPPTPHPTQTPPRTAICLVAYHDQDRDGVYDAGETLRPAVAFTIFNETAVVANYITDGLSEPYCIEGLSKGQYHVTRSIGPNEVLTNDGNWAIMLRQGDVAQLEFGSYLVSPGAPIIIPTAPALDGTAAAGAASTPSQSSSIQPTSPPSSTPNAPRNTTVFLLVGLVVVTFFVAVIFLLIQKQLKK